MYSAKTILVRSALFVAMTAGLAACGSGGTTTTPRSSTPTTVTSSSTDTVSSTPDTTSSTPGTTSSTPGTTSSTPGATSSTPGTTSSTPDTTSSTPVVVVSSSSTPIVVVSSSSVTPSSSSVTPASSSSVPESSSSVTPASSSSVPASSSSSAPAPAPTPVFNGLTDGQTLPFGSDLTAIEITTANNAQVASVSLYLNDQLVRIENNEPYTWPTDSQLQNPGPGTYELRAVVTASNDETSEETITVTIANQVPPVSSSSVPPVSSSSVPPVSSSSVPPVSSSSIASSSSEDTCMSPSSAAASSAAPAITQCSTHTQAAGMVEFARCAGCHEAFVGSISAPTGTATGNIDANDTLFEFGANSDTDLAAFINQQMGPFVGGCDEDCAKNIEVHIRGFSDAPICLDNPPVASSSEASSDCMPISSAPVSSSSEASSSSAANPATVEFVFPPQGSHLGGQTSTPVSLKVVETDPSGTVEGVTLNGEAMTAGANGVWELASLAVDGSSNQSFDVTVSVGGNALEANAFEVNNEGGPNVSKAGNTRIFAATGVAVKDDGTLYFSNAYDGRVYEYDPVTAESTVVYQRSSPPVQVSEELFWPIAISGDDIYLLEDSYSYGDTVGSGEYDVNLVVIDSAGTATSYPGVDDFGDKAVFSTKSIIADLNSEIPTSGNTNQTADRFPTIYSLDFAGDSPAIFQRWFLKPLVTEVFSLDITASAGSELRKDLGLIALASFIDGNDSRFLIIREYESANLTGSPSLIEVTPRAASTRVVANGDKVATLDFTNQPTAAVYSADGTAVYIADTNRIWKLDTVNFNEELISSNNTLPMLKGNGPGLGGNISAMAIHPTMPNYLYVATGKEIMLVNIDNGNRVTLIK